MRKAEISPEMIYWMVYIPMTLIIIGLFRVLPIMVFGNTVETHDMQNAIYTDRIITAARWQHPMTLRNYYTHIDKEKIHVAAAFDTDAFLYDIGFKISLDTTELYLNKAFYEDAKPLAPVRYEEFVETRPIILVNGKLTLTTLTIDQVFSTRPKQ